MRKSQRLAARASAENASIQKKARQEERQNIAAARDAAIAARLSRRPRDLVDRLIGVDVGRPRTFLEAVEAKAPRLIIRDYKDALLGLAKLNHLRPLETWKPAGKGRESLFRSLCEHLLAKYPMPPFLWSAFSAGDSAALLARVVEAVARGESLFQLGKTGTFPIPLTRAQCHEFMQSPVSLSIMRALRQVQVKAEEGDRHLLENWMKLDIARRLHSAEDEAFWLTVLRFFAQNPMIEPSQLGPIVDFIHYRRRQNRAFSMKGRTGAAMLRDLAAWHVSLSKTKHIAKLVYERAGFNGFALETTTAQRRGPRLVEVWRITEILTSKALVEEGRALHHCVASYSWRISEGTVSIWSLTYQAAGETSRRITIEVQNAKKTILQTRGLQNRYPTPEENKVINLWATQTGLTRNNYSW